MGTKGDPDGWKGDNEGIKMKNEGWKGNNINYKSLGHTLEGKLSSYGATLLTNLVSIDSRQSD